MAANTPIDIINKTKRALPRVRFSAGKSGGKDKAAKTYAFVQLLNAIKDKALGPDYELSLVFIGNKESQKLNREHRKKDKPTNILSFPLDEQTGEIFIDLKKCEEEAPSFERELPNFLVFLFIHGCLHLKGFDHGSTMESKEKSLRAFFDI